MDDGEVENWRRAGRIASEAREHGAGLIRPGARLLDVAEGVEEFVRKHGARPAFPVNIAIDSVAAHFTPRRDDRAVFAAGNLVKLDVGVHVDGCIGDTAVTVEVGTRNWGDLIVASREALSVAVGMVRPGLDAGRIGEAVETVIRSKGFVPVENLTGHGIERYALHSGLSVPSVKSGAGGIIREGTVIAIEPFATNGLGRVDGRRPSNIYRMQRKRVLFASEPRALMAHIEKNFSSLPFAQRWCAGAAGVKNPDGALQSLIRTGVVHSYAILEEIEDGMVSQAEHTVLVTAGGCEVLTR